MLTSRQERINITNSLKNGIIAIIKQRNNSILKNNMRQKFEEFW